MEELIECHRCGRERELNQFYRRKEISRGYTYLCKECLKNSSFDRVIVTKYGITRSSFEKLRLAQNNKCAICECEMTDAKPYTSTSATIDHDHACCPTVKTCWKCIRGILCRQCNYKLGIYEAFSKNPRVEAYLKGTSK